jgi:hypothetical protein
LDLRGELRHNVLEVYAKAFSKAWTVVAYIAVVGLMSSVLMNECGIGSDDMGKQALVPAKKMDMDI